MIGIPEIQIACKDNVTYIPKLTMGSIFLSYLDKDLIALYFNSFSKFTIAQGSDIQISIIYPPDQGGYKRCRSFIGQMYGDYLSDSCPEVALAFYMMTMVGTTLEWYLKFDEKFETPKLEVPKLQLDKYAISKIFHAEKLENIFTRRCTELSRF